MRMANKINVMQCQCRVLEQAKSETTILEQAKSENTLRINEAFCIMATENLTHSARGTAISDAWKPLLRQSGGCDLISQQVRFFCCCFLNFFFRLIRVCYVYRLFLHDSLCAVVFMFCIFSIVILIALYITVFNVVIGWSRNCRTFRTPPDLLYYHLTFELSL